jgi:hypothetical protein
MLQKFVVGLLVLTVVGAVGVGFYEASRNSDDTTANVLAKTAGDDTLLTNTGAEPVITANTQPLGQMADQPAPLAAAQAAATPTAQPARQSIQEQQVQAESMVGDPWSGIGTIIALQTNGITLQRADGSQIFVELGPSHFWQGQDITLTVGEQVTVVGFFNGENYHSATVIKADGTQLSLRTETGQPLWSGGGSANAQTSTLTGAQTGAQNANGNTNGSGNAAAPQVAPEDWITVDGTVTGVGTQALTMQTQTGEMLTLQLGSAAFMAEQGVTFASSDPISVLGFWQDGQFRAGEITKTATGERVMLLDPNGRPLWAGPGRAGSQGGNGNGQGGGGNSGNNGGQGKGGNGGQGGNGQGSQGQGQNTQAQGIQVSADRWEQISGIVAQVEPLALTLQVDGKPVVVVLGQVDFWTEQGIAFMVGDSLTVDGFWLNGQFDAGIVTFDTTGEQLTIRDDFGRLLWTNNTGGQGGNGNGGGGNGYQGGRNPNFQGSGNNG